MGEVLIKQQGSSLRLKLMASLDLIRDVRQDERVGPTCYEALTDASCRIEDALRFALPGDDPA